MRLRCSFINERWTTEEDQITQNIFRNGIICVAWLHHLMLSILFDVWKPKGKWSLQVRCGSRALRRNHFLLFPGISVDFYQTNPSQKCHLLLTTEKRQKVRRTNWRLGVAFAFEDSLCLLLLSIGHCVSHSVPRFLSFYLSIQHPLPLDISTKVSINENRISVCIRLLLVYAWVGYHLTHIQPNLSAKNLNKNCSDFTFSHLFTLTSFKSHFLFSENFFLCLRLHYASVWRRMNILKRTKYILTSSI